MPQRRNQPEKVERAASRRAPPVPEAALEKMEAIADARVVSGNEPTADVLRLILAQMRLVVAHLSLLTNAELSETDTAERGS